MLRSVITGAGGCLHFAWLPIFQKDTDSIFDQTPTYQKAKAEALYEETGWERVHAMFYSSDELHGPSRELHFIYDSGICASLVAGIMGGFLHSRVAFVNFIQNNQASLYETHLDAKSKLQTEMTLSFAKGAFRYGWRAALFTMSFVGISTVMSVYKGKASVSEYTTAGAITGGLYKTNLGLRGMVSGAFFGGLLGTFAGVTTVLLLKLSGVSMQDIRYYQFKWREARNNAIHGVAKKQLEVKDPVLEFFPSGGDNSLTALDAIPTETTDEKTASKETTAKETTAKETTVATTQTVSTTK